jgi:hypothetical protein
MRISELNVLRSHDRPEEWHVVAWADDPGGAHLARLSDSVEALTSIKSEAEAHALCSRVRDILRSHRVDAKIYVQYDVSQETQVLRASELSQS